MLKIEWGQMEGVQHDLCDENGDPPVKYTVRRHDEGGDGKSVLDVMTQIGAATTTKKIVKSSLESRKKLIGFDDVI